MKGIEQIIIAIVFIIVVCMIIYFLYNTLTKEEHINVPSKVPDEEVDEETYKTGDVVVFGYIKNNKTYIVGKYRDTTTGKYIFINNLVIEEPFRINDILYADHQYKLNYIQLGSYSFLKSINSSLADNYGTTPIAIISESRVIYNKDHPAFDGANSVIEALSDGGSASFLNNIEMKFFSSGTWGQNCTKQPEAIKYPNYQTISSNGVFNINYLDIDYNNDISEANIAINEVDSCSNCKAVPGYDFDINPNKVGCINVYTKCMDTNQNIRFGLVKTRVMVPYYDRSAIDNSNVGGADNKYNFGYGSDLNNNLHPCGTGVYTEYGDINHNKKEWGDISNDFLNEIDDYGFGVIVNTSTEDLDNRLLKYNLNINSFIPVLTNKYDGSFYFDINLSPNLIQSRSGEVKDIPMSRFKCYLAKFYNLYSNELNNQFAFTLDVTDLGGYYENKKLTLKRNEKELRQDIRINVNPMLLNIIDNIDINDDIDNIYYIPGSQNYLGSYGHHILNKIPLFKIEILNSNKKTQISNLQNRRAVSLFGAGYESDCDSLFGVLLRITSPDGDLNDNMINNIYEQYFNDLTKESNLADLGYTKASKKLFKELTDAAFNEDWYRRGTWPEGYERETNWEENLGGKTPDETDPGYYAFAEGDNFPVKPVLSNLLNIETFNNYLKNNAGNIYEDEAGGEVQSQTFIKLLYGLVIPVSRLQVYDETSRLNDAVADEDYAQGVTVLEVDKQTYLEFLYSKEEANTWQDIFDNTNIKKYYNYTIRSELPISRDDLNTMMGSDGQQGVQWSFSFFKTIKTEYKFDLDDILESFEIKWNWNKKGKVDLGVFLNFKKSPSDTLDSSESGNNKSVWGWINDDKLKSFSWTVSRVKLTLIQTHYWGTQFLPLLTSSQKPAFPARSGEPDDPHKIPNDPDNDAELHNVWDRQWQTVKTYLSSGIDSGGRVIGLSHDLNSNVQLIQADRTILVEFSGSDSNLTAGQYIIDKLSVDLQPVVPPAQAMQTTKLGVSFETPEIDISTINFTEKASPVYDDDKINFVYEPFNENDFLNNNNIKSGSEYYYTEPYSDSYHTQKQILTSEGIPSNLNRNNILRLIKIQGDKNKIFFDTGPLTTQVCIDTNKNTSSAFMSTINWGVANGRSFNISLSYTNDGDGGSDGLQSDKVMGCENRIGREDLGDDDGDYLHLASFLCTFGKGLDETTGETIFVDPIKNGIDKIDDIDLDPIVVHSDSLTPKYFGGVNNNAEKRFDINCGEGNYKEYAVNEFPFDDSGENNEDIFIQKRDHYCQMGGDLLCVDSGTKIAITNNSSLDACSNLICKYNFTNNDDNDWRWRFTSDGGIHYTQVLKNLQNLYFRVAIPNEENTACYSNDPGGDICNTRIGKPNETGRNDVYDISQPVHSNPDDTNYFKNVRDMIKNNCFSTYTKMYRNLDIQGENAEINFKCLNKKGEPWSHRGGDGPFEPWREIHEGFNTYLLPKESTGNLRQPYVHIQGVTNVVNRLHKKIYKKATGGCALKIFDEPGFDMALKPEYMYGQDSELKGKTNKLKLEDSGKPVDPITKAIFSHMEKIEDENPNNPTIKFKDTINANDFFYNFVDMTDVDNKDHYSDFITRPGKDEQASGGGYFNNYLTNEHNLLNNNDLVDEIKEKFQAHSNSYSDRPANTKRKYLDEDYDGSEATEGLFVANSPDYYLSHDLKYKVNHMAKEEANLYQIENDPFDKGIKIGNLFGWLNDYYASEGRPADREWTNSACCLGGEYNANEGCIFNSGGLIGEDNHHQNQLNMYINTISTKGEHSRDDKWRMAFDGAADLGSEAKTEEELSVDRIESVAPGSNFVIKQGTGDFNSNIERGLYNRLPGTVSSLKKIPQSLDPGIIENLSTRQNTYYNFIDTFLLDIGENVNVNITKKEYESTDDTVEVMANLPARSYFQSDIASSDIGSKRTHDHGVEYNLTSGTTSNDKFTVFRDNTQISDTYYAKKQAPDPTKSGSGYFYDGKDIIYGNNTVNVDPEDPATPGDFNELPNAWGDLISLDIDGDRPTMSDPTSTGANIYYIGHESLGTRTGVTNTIPEFETLGTIRDYYKKNQEFLNVAANARQRHFREAHIKKCQEDENYARAYGCMCHTGEDHSLSRGSLKRSASGNYVYWSPNTHRWLTRCNNDVLADQDGLAYAGNAFERGVTYIKIPDDRKFHDERVYKVTYKDGTNQRVHDYDWNQQKITGKGSWEYGWRGDKFLRYEGCYNNSNVKAWGEVDKDACNDRKGWLAQRELSTDWHRTDKNRDGLRRYMQPSGNPGGAYNFNKGLDFDN